MNGFACSLRPCQKLQRIPVLGNQGYLLRPAPTLDLDFRSQRIFSRAELLHMNQQQRPSIMGVAAWDQSLMVLMDTTIRIIAVSRVVGTVRAAKHVEVESHVTW